MRLNWLEVRDFRNHRELALSVPPGLTVVAGPNGQGKTNLLEAIHYLCSLASPRVSSDLPLVRWGRPSAYLRGEAEAAGGRFLIEVEIRSGGQNRVQVNRSPVRRKRDLRRNVRTVFSGPDDLAVVLGDPEERRRFMDDAVRSLWPMREAVMGHYERALRQRNRLLKDWDGSGDPRSIEAWDEELVAHGATLTASRAEAVQRMGERSAEEFQTICGEGGGVLVAEYRPSVAAEDEESPGAADLFTGAVDAGPDGAGDPMVERLRRSFRARLAQRRGDELVRRTTLVGPHRDELALAVQGLAARGFASHGEAWGAAVGLRLAQARAVAEELGEPPILLLDDPFSGLDPERRRRLAANLEGRGQVLIAVPDDDHVPEGASVWRVGEGVVVAG